MPPKHKQSTWNTLFHLHAIPEPMWNTKSGTSFGVSYGLWLDNILIVLSMIPIKKTFSPHCHPPPPSKKNLYPQCILMNQGPNLYVRVTLGMTSLDWKLDSPIFSCNEMKWKWKSFQMFFKNLCDKVLKIDL